MGKPKPRKLRLNNGDARDEIEHADALAEPSASAAVPSAEADSAVVPGVVAASARTARAQAAREAKQSKAQARAEKRSEKQSVARSGAGFPWEMAAPAVFASAVLAAGLSAPKMESPARAPERRAAEPVRILPTVPPSELWMVKPRTAFSFVSLQGTLSKGAIVAGHIGLAGEVSSVLVREGQHVDVGDSILTLKTETSSTSSRTVAVPRVEAQQSQAEGQQVQAVRRKEALELRIAQAGLDYTEAQARLDSANKKLAEARATLKRVSAGEAVPDPSAASTPAPRKRRRVVRGAQGPSRADSARLERAQSENRAAQAAVEQAEKAVREASGKARPAREASSALSRERQAESALDSARVKLKSAQAQPDEGEAKADEGAGEGEDKPKADKPDAGAGKAEAVAEARAAVSRAESELEEARQESRAAQQESRGGEADQARARLARASERAAQASRELRAAQKAARAPRPQAVEEVEPEPEPRAPKSTLSVSASVRRVREAMSEAAAAVSNAEKLKARVEGFKRSANTISDDIQTSARTIVQAQEQVLETTVRASLSTMRAPASGTVLSVAGVGESVGEGQTVVRVASGPRGLEATLQDSSEAWKQLRPEMTLPGRLLSTPLSGDSARANGIASGQAEVVTLGSSPLRMGAPILLKVRAVQPPEAPGGAAQIRVAVVPNSSLDVLPRDDMAVAISLSKGSSDLISIPAIAVARSAGSQPIVGVLREITNSSGAAPKAKPAPGLGIGSVEMSPAEAGDKGLGSFKAPLQVLEAKNKQAEPVRERLFEIEWRPVALSDALPAVLATERAADGPQNGFVGFEKMKKVVSGLEPGERILRDASQWQGRFVSTPGKPLRVRLAPSVS